MTDAAVTLNTINFIRTSMIGDLADELTMTAKAVLLHDHAAARLHLDWLVEVLECEIVGVPKAILGFGEVLANKIMRNMTRVAGGKRLVAGLCPAVKLLTHDVAVHAGLWIVREVRRSLRIDKRVTP